MNDLISREAVIEMLYYNCDESCSAIIRDVENLSTIDAVEVVRCGKCKYYETELCENQDNHEDWFCADGERKEATE